MQNKKTTPAVFETALPKESAPSMFEADAITTPPQRLDSGAETLI